MMNGKPMMAAGNGPPASEPDSDEKPCIFLSAESLGGKKVKVGDTITLTVRDVDPETGDVQADLTEGGETDENNEGAMAAFDRSMPEESEEA